MTPLMPIPMMCSPASKFVLNRGYPSPWIIWTHSNRVVSSSAGDPDPSFGTGGRVLHAGTDFVDVNDAVVLADDKILLAGAADRIAMSFRDTTPTVRSTPASAPTAPPPANSQASKILPALFTSSRCPAASSWRRRASTAIRVSSPGSTPTDRSTRRLPTRE